MVLVGQVGRELVGLLNEHGPLAVGLSGEDAGLFTRRTARGAVVDGAAGRHRSGRRRRGRSTRPPSSTCIDAGRIPVVSTVAPDDGRPGAQRQRRHRGRGARGRAGRGRSWSCSPTSRGSTPTGRTATSLVAEITADELDALLPSLRVRDDPEDGGLPARGPRRGAAGARHRRAACRTRCCSRSSPTTGIGTMVRAGDARRRSRRHAPPRRRRSGDAGSTATAAR